MKYTTTQSRKTGFLVGFLFLVCSLVHASTSYYFYVQFANKNNSPYSLENPSAYLSAKSIERRMLRASQFDSTDLPINPNYLLQVENLGVHVHSRSKWINGATVLVSDSSKMSAVRSLPFVKWVKYTGKIDLASPVSNKRSKKLASTTNYGSATAQIEQLNGKYLHNLGYRGNGIVIGVIDAGFYGADVNPAFDSLRLQGRLLGTKDIINPKSNIYAEDAHGGNVLSTMTGNLPNLFLGTAPDASYWLIRTEYSPTEYLVETDFWCAGIEFADSVGVDVVNSSLGYTQFDDASMNYTYADMNGEVSRASRAASLAAKKGIIVCNSAGNDGNKTWRYIGVPGDAKGIITVGGVTNTGISSVFSSFGPSSDSRVKPEICSVGTSSAIVPSNGVPSSGNGTSFASPIMAGMMACFLQAAKTVYPPCDLDTLLKAVFESASIYANPTAQLGYGIPNFQLALAKLPFANALKIAQNKELVVAFNPTDKTIRIRLFSTKNSLTKIVKIYSVTGNLLINEPMIEPETVLNADHLTVGMYIVNIIGNGNTSSHKVVIK